MTERDWFAWHHDYDDPDTALAHRLAAVRQQITAALDAAPPGRLRTISLCAGQGRDLIGVLARHPRRGFTGIPAPLERGARMFTFTGHHPRTGPARHRS